MDAFAHHAAEAAKRRPAAGLLVVREAIEVALDLERCPQARDEPAFAGRKGVGSLFHILRTRWQVLKKAPDPRQRRSAST